MKDDAVLLLDEAGAWDPALLQASLGPHLYVAENPEKATAAMVGARFRVVIAALRGADGRSGLDVLRAAKVHDPTCMRILVVSGQDELPELMRAPPSAYVDRVITRPRRPDRLLQLIRTIVHSGAQPRAPSVPVARHVEAILCWSASLIAHEPVIVLRGPALRRDLDQVEFVLPRGDSFERLREELARHWGAPLKAAGASVAREAKQHPVLRALSPVNKRDELYAMAWPGGDAWGYAALLRWRGSKKVTVALGVVGMKGHSTVVRMVRDVAHEELHSHALPPLSDADLAAPAVLVPEYDWVRTPTYIGPDRRKRATPFLDRYAFWGRRRWIPKGVHASQERFVDRLTPFSLACGLACLALATFDTVLTLRHARGGALRELNPLLRALLHGHVGGFLAAKNALTVLSFLVLARFQAMNAGPYLLGGLLASYAALDTYWLRLLSRS